MKNEYGKDCDFRITLRFMLLGTDFNDKINQFAYLKNSQGDLKAMKHGCVSGLGCGCETRQFLKKVGAGVAGLGD